MKKLLIIGAAALVMFSCKKDQEKGDLIKDGKKVPVTFTTRLEVTDKEYKAGVSDLETAAKNANYLYYILFDEQGNFVKQKTYVKSTDPDFGQVKDTLAMAEYNAHFFASKLPLNINVSNLQNSHIVFSDNDIFAAGGLFYIGGNSYKQALEMKRILSKLTVSIADTIPANASYLVLSRNGARSYFFNGTTPVQAGTVSTQTIQLAAHRGQILPPVTTTTIENNVSFLLTASVYDVNNNLIASRFVSVSPVPNKETIVTGKIFSNGALWSLLINDEWDPSKDVVKL